MLKTKKELNPMFPDLVHLCPITNVAVKKAEELYRTLLMDSFGDDGNLWKVELYLKSLYN